MRKPWFCQDCRVIMIYNSKQDFHKCPVCGAEVWHDANTAVMDEVTSLMRDMAPTHKPKECLPSGGSLPGGGSKSSKVKKPESKKKSLSTLNCELYNS